MSGPALLQHGAQGLQARRIVDDCTQLHACGAGDLGEGTGAAHGHAGWLIRARRIEVDIEQHAGSFLRPALEVLDQSFLETGSAELAR